jgi:Ca2+-binding RTX toxin-like protein
MTGILLALREWRHVLFLVAFMCLLVLGLPPQAGAAGSGAFTLTGSMSTPRSGAAAAPLPGGRVLVAGGSVGGFRIERVFPTPEVFDPATNSFSSAGIGSMSVPRSDAVAAPLSDGRVLLAGGFNPSGGALSEPSSAEVFDPATGTFSSAGIGSMSVERRGAAAAPLPDGRVLVAGGHIGVGSDLSSAEIFAPVSCRGKQATIVGTSVADQIFGGPKADVIVGVGGNDKLSGLAGNDLICGGQGDDTLSGGAGNDRLYGEEGNDTLWGLKGKDKLSGQAGDDKLKGGPGKDTLKGGAGKDTLTGGEGKDILKGGPDKDSLKGGAGKDKQVQ